MSGGYARALVRPNAYADSITLLQVTSGVAALPDIVDAAVVMATELNHEVLRDAGLLVDEAAGAGPNDLVIAVRGTTASAVDAALSRAEMLLAARKRVADAHGEQRPPLSLRSARRRAPTSNVALVSVPGQFAAAEARQALLEGLHVFLFSDNVPIEDEVSLKLMARERSLLVMGPDCGTAIIDGVGLGFANAVRRGRVGLVGASGTGLQEVTSLIHRAGGGVSHAVGTGGRDLHAEVGGITTLQALALLGHDASTEVIVVISKPSDPGVVARVLGAAAATGKPAIACMLGGSPVAPDGVTVVDNLAAAAALAIQVGESPRQRLEAEEVHAPRLDAQQRRVYGLYCGGTLCEEAALVLRAADGASIEQRLVDFGDDQYTRGRAHPMIDPTLRNQAIVEAGSDPRAGVVLLDVMLGFGSHPDPAGATAPAVRQAREIAAASGRELAVLAHVVGTDWDAQALDRQEAALRDVGVTLCPSNYDAAVAAVDMLRQAGG